MFKYVFQVNACLPKIHAISGLKYPPCNSICKHVNTFETLYSAVLTMLFLSFMLECQDRCSQTAELNWNYW